MAVITMACFAATPARAEFGDLLFRLAADDGVDGDNFGGNVEISGTTALISASQLFTNGRGSAYLFDLTAGTQLRKLTASDATLGDEFGVDVAILGNTALVGAGSKDNAGIGSGAAYLFDVTTGQELFKLQSSDAARNFGYGVALNGNKAIVTAPWHAAGVAYVFDVSTGKELLKYSHSGGVHHADGTTGDQFGGNASGGSIAISGSTAIGGARYSDAGGIIDAGAAYLFDVATGHELLLLQPSDAKERDYFGHKVAIHGNMALIGATQQFAGGSTSGAAYLFDITTGQELIKLSASSEPGASFGWSVALNDNTALVGARFEDAAYLFDVETGQLLKKFTGPADSQFGTSVAMNNNVAIIGARREGAQNNQTGAAYVFDISRNLGPPGDFNKDGTVDAADYVVWRNGLGTTYTQADFNTWRANFGRSAGGAATVADRFGNIPEPTSAAIVFAGATLLAYSRRRRFGPATAPARPGGAVFDNQNAAPREPVAPALLGRVERCLNERACEKHRPTQTSCEGAMRSFDDVSGFQTSAHGASSCGAVKSRSLTMIAFIRRWLVAVGIMMCFATARAHAEFGDELFKLNASDAATGDTFGRRVDISGNVAIVGAPSKDGYSGAAYLFDVTTGQELHQLIASDAAPNVWFGGGVGISGNTAIVSGFDTDKAYLFDVTTGQELRTLATSDPMAKNFGGSFTGPVAIWGNTAIVGDLGHTGSGDQTGAAYVFDVSTGQELFKLTASDAAARDQFGRHVAISGDVAIIGAPQGSGTGVGAAYLFDVTTGQQLFKLTASDGRPRDFFGNGVALSGDIAIVGASGTYAGVPSEHETTAAYVFDVNTGQQLRKLESHNSFDGFGMFVDIYGTTAMVAAPQEVPRDGYSWSAPGSVYLFEVSTGELLKKIVPSDTHPGQVFGHDLGIDGDFAVIGARYGHNGTIQETGSAYLFDVSRGPPLPGDFNTDGTVDAADYIVWRNSLGTTYTQAAFNTWRANFGKTFADAAAIIEAFRNDSPGNVPEPMSSALAPLGLLSLYIRGRGSLNRMNRRESRRNASEIR